MVLAKQIPTKKPSSQELTANYDKIQTLEMRKKECLKDPEKYRQEIAKIDRDINFIIQIKETKEKWVYDATIAVQAAEVLLASVETFLKNVATPEPSQMSSKLSRAVIREKIRKMEITHLLYLNIISSGGESISGRNLWNSGKFAYISGAVANCILTKTDGTIVFADFFPVLNRCTFELSGNKAPHLSQINFEDK